MTASPFLTVLIGRNTHLLLTNECHAGECSHIKKNMELKQADNEVLLEKAQQQQQQPLAGRRNKRTDSFFAFAFAVNCGAVSVIAVRFC